jgi:hypothetical protein
MLLEILATLVMGGPNDAKMIDLKDGFVRVETKAYIFEVPKGWAVSSETPWGARDMTPEKGSGAMGAMTAPPSTQSWDQLYRTSLYFITREKPGKATPYVLGKAPQGYETMSFQVAGTDGFADRRYTILKSKENRILALSVKIPSKDQEKKFMDMFDRMIKSAKILS